MAGRSSNPLDPSAAFGGSSIPSVAGVGRGGVTSDINVTPMVDVMLVLLIIFMVITPVLATYEAELPEAQHVVPEPDDDVITLGIDAQGVYHVNGDPVSPTQLTGTLRGIYAERPGDHLLFLRADREVGYDVVLSAVDAARAAGVRTIGAITVPLEPGGR
ncbi:MAG TPA: biopolymer transporter ExbD [Longimicrobiales bacterium]|nr:biopolymer transporter ExbD [Longimicrobiales bacterium]